MAAIEAIPHLVRIGDVVVQLLRSREPADVSPDPCPRFPPTSNMTATSRARCGTSTDRSGRPTSGATSWTNDPNGLVFYKGEYHLFFQHNPFDVKPGNKTWGHAVGPDMVHWTQIDNALAPDKMGTRPIPSR